MKKRQVFGFVVAGLLAGFVSHAVAQSSTAYSSSAVGVIKKTLPAGGRVLLSIPLDQESDTGDGFTFSSIPAIAALPNGSVAYFWDMATQAWIAQPKTRGSWGNEKDRLITVGEAFFLKNTQSTNIELVISGEVPADASLSKGISGDNARNLVANPYPVPTVLTNFDFAAKVSNGSVVYFWDVDEQAWVAQPKTRGSWGNEKNRSIAPAEGFFIKQTADDIVWTESRPYTWPN